MCRGLGLSASFLWYSWGRWICNGEVGGKDQAGLSGGFLREAEGDNRCGFLSQVKQTNTGQQWKQRTLQSMLKSRNQV